MDFMLFEEILRELYDLTNGRIEASFSSKMYATLYPEKPIWDQFVLKFLGFTGHEFSLRSLD